MKPSDFIGYQQPNRWRSFRAGFIEGWCNGLRLVYLASCVTVAVIVMWWAGIDELVGRSSDYWAVAGGAWLGSAVTLIAAGWAVKR